MVNRDHAIETAERVASVFSVLGAILIISTFVYDNRFRKPINRLVFYAAWGNLFANVATLISREGIERGINSPLCQFQAFLIQWFMPADALFTFAMAVNVYLTFFKQYDAASLRKLEWRYLALCYGLPFIPALTFLLIDNAERGKVYGSANLWCWISLKYNGLRIGAFYGPVWIIILFDIFIYIKVGSVVFRWRKSLVSLNTGRASPGPNTTVKERPRYEVNVVSQVPHSRTQSLTSRPLSISNNQTFSPLHTRNASDSQRLSDQSTQVNTTISYIPGQSSTAPRAVDANRATLQYCYTAFLFAFALIVTWVPSTVNRLYTLINDTGKPSPFGLDFSSALVLPLQGLWNTIIYMVTSWTACRALWHERTSECGGGCLSRSTRPPPPVTPGHKLQHLGSTDFNLSDPESQPQPHPYPRPSQGKDPYPLSPIESVFTAAPSYKERDHYRLPLHTPPAAPLGGPQYQYHPTQHNAIPRPVQAFVPNRDNKPRKSSVSEHHDERADTLADLDLPPNPYTHARSASVRQGRGQFDWGNAAEERSASRGSNHAGADVSSPIEDPFLTRSQSLTGMRGHPTRSNSWNGSRNGSRSANGLRRTGSRDNERERSYGSWIDGASDEGGMRDGTYVLSRAHSRQGSGHIVEQMRGSGF